MLGISAREKQVLLFISFLVRERAEFNKSCNLIGSGSGRNFPIRPALGGRNRHSLKNVSIFSRNLLNEYSYYVSKNLAVKPLSSTWIISVFITVCSLEIVQFVANLAMITALKCSGLSHAFRCIVEKNKNVIHQPKSVRIGKNSALCLIPPSAVSKTLGTVFPNTELPAGDNLYMVLDYVVYTGDTLRPGLAQWWKNSTSNSGACARNCSGRYIRVG